MRFSFLYILLAACTTSEEKVASYNNTPEATIVSHTSGEDFFEGYSTIFQARMSDGNHSLEALGGVPPINVGGRLILPEEVPPRRENRLARHAFRIGFYRSKFALGSLTFWR